MIPTIWLSLRSSVSRLRSEVSKSGTMAAMDPASWFADTSKKLQECCGMRARSVCMHARLTATERHTKLAI